MLDTKSDLILFIDWIYQHYYENVSCHYIDSDTFEKRFIFQTSNSQGSLAIWPNGIIEEEIYDQQQNTLFYFHYKFIDLKQGKNYFYEFYKFLTQYNSPNTLTKIIICCSSGLSAAFFVTNLKELIALRHLQLDVIALGINQLETSYLNYQEIYLAPQIAYLQPQIINLTKQQIPVYQIPTSIYATYDYNALLETIITAKESPNYLK